MMYADPVSAMVSNVSYQTISSLKYTREGNGAHTASKISCNAGHRCSSESNWISPMACIVVDVEVPSAVVSLNVDKDVECWERAGD